MRKYYYIIPTLLTILYAMFMFVYIFSGFNMNSGLVIFVSILFAFPVVVHFLQTIKCISHAIENKKTLWIFLLIFLNLIVLPYYGNKYRLKKTIFKNFVITYLVAVVFLSIITVLYSFTLVGKNTDMKLTTNDKKVSFEVNNTWKEKNTDGYSIYAGCQDKNLALGVLTYDLTKYENYTEADIIEGQKNYLASKLGTFELYKEEVVNSYEDKTVKTVEYLAKDEEEKNKIYKLSIIKFNDNENYVIYIFQAMLEKDYDKYNSEMNEILKSAELN